MIESDCILNVLLIQIILIKIIFKEIENVPILEK